MRPEKLQGRVVTHTEGNKVIVGRLTNPMALNEAGEVTHVTLKGEIVETRIPGLLPISEGGEHITLEFLPVGLFV